MNRTPRSKADIETAHQLLQDGDREEAYAVVRVLLDKNPADPQAQGLRDRIHSQENSEAVVRERVEDSFEDEDTSPLVPWAFLIIGIAGVVAAVKVAIKPMQLGMRIGFNTEIAMGGAMLGKASKYPVHNMLITPTLLLCMAFVCFYTFRRARRRR